MNQLTTIANLIQYCLPALTLSSGITSLASSAVVEKVAGSSAKEITTEFASESSKPKEKLHHT